MAIIRMKHEWRGQQTLTVEAYVRNVLTDTFCAEGRVERADYKVEQCAAAMGRLIDLLAERGMLSAVEVQEVAGGIVRDHDAVMELQHG